MCQRGLQGEHGGPLGCLLSVGRGKAAGPGAAVTASDCPQVELRSYVSEPELATFSGDTTPSSLGLVGSESRYQTLPGRGRHDFLRSLPRDPHRSHTTARPQPSPGLCNSSACGVGPPWGSSCLGPLGCRQGASFLPLAHILILILFYYICPWEQW